MKGALKPFFAVGQRRNMQTLQNSCILNRVCDWRKWWHQTSLWTWGTGSI